MRISIAAALALTTWIAIALGLMLTSAAHFISQPLALAITLFGPIAALATAYYSRGSRQAFALGAIIPLAIGLWMSLNEISGFASNPQTAFMDADGVNQWTSYPPLGMPVYGTPQLTSPSNTTTITASSIVFSQGTLPVWSQPFWRRTGTFSLLAIAGGFLSCLIQASAAKKEASAQSES